jgi:hypothetical protein
MTKTARNGKTFHRIDEKFLIYFVFTVGWQFGAQESDSSLDCGAI